MNGLLQNGTSYDFDLAQKSDKGLNVSSDKEILQEKQAL